MAKLWRKQSSASETEHLEGDIVVPSCNVVLDNTKTLQHAGGASSDSGSSTDDLERTTSYKDRDEWAKFKFEIYFIFRERKNQRLLPMNYKTSVKQTFSDVSFNTVGKVYY